VKLEHAKQWVKALRSMKYKQCKNRLMEMHSYCCLGVLTIELKPKGFCRALGVDRNALALLREGLIASFLPSVFGEKFNVMNDTANMSFDQIADVIDLAICSGDYKEI
jgi:hypothetical protein